jgi:PAS domain S-box-containing protein
MFGYEPGDFPPSFESWTSLIHPDEQDKVTSDLLKQIKERRSTFEIEYRARTKDGDERWIDARGKAIEWDEEGNVTRVIGINNDITGRRRTEIALRQANRQLSLLSGITRHDILNNVTVILGYLGIAEVKCTDPNLEMYLKRMEQATRAIQAQVEFTRIYHDLGTNEPQWQRLEAILSELESPPQITLTTSLQGVEVNADPMLEKALFNLLDNSIRHGQQVTRIQVSSRQEGENLTIVWEDDGGGIPIGEKDQIFIRGYGKNTGLGLFLVREILSLTGITIRETGVEGEGVRFEMTIPKGNFRYPKDR